MVRKLTLFVALALTAVLGACSGPERRTETSPASGGPRTGSAPVASGTAPVGSRARVARATPLANSSTTASSAPEADSSGETDVAPIGRGSEAGGRPVSSERPAQGSSGEESLPVGPQAAGSARGRRERIVDEASEEERPVGRSEAHFESDGASYKPGVGLMPRFRLTSVEPAHGSLPDSVMGTDRVMSTDRVIGTALPGSHLDLPPPEAPKPAVVQKAAEQVDSEPHPIAPKPVN